MRGNPRAIRRRPLLAALAACLALPAGCGDDDDQAAAAKRSTTVDVASFRFMPDSIRVKAGGTVTWVHRDRAPHTAETEAKTAGGFDTGRLDRGERETVRLDRPGTFRYFCVYHRFMEGTVEVVE